MNNRGMSAPPDEYLHVVFLLSDIERGYNYFVPKEHVLLGRCFHVLLDFTVPKPTARIEPHPFDGSHPRYATRIKFFDNEVTLDPPAQFSIYLHETLPDDFVNNDVDVIYPLVADALTRGEVTQACRNLASDIEIAKFYSTEHRRSSNLEAVKTVIARLDLCARLNGEEARDILETHQRDLVTYLLLTCFDRLGQPARFLTFDQFLSSRRKRAARAAILESMSVNDPVESAKALYQGYLKQYGVKNSFFRFLNEVLPASYRVALLESLTIMDTPQIPLTGNNHEASDDEKLRYLFDLRNAYTHRAEFKPGLTSYRSIAPFPHEENTLIFHDQIHRQTTFRSVLTKSWIPTLFETVRQGLVARLQNSIIPHDDLNSDE
jgi:hypothetical protein